MLACMLRSLPLAAVLAAPAFGAPAIPPQDPPPSIVLIVADDLGYGDLGCYGQRRLRTPHIDRLAAEGMLFTQFYAGSTVCAPSRAVLMTGQHTGRTYIRGNAPLDLRPEDVTVAEVLRDAGYATACFGKWGLGHHGTDGMPTRQGFDTFFGFLDQAHAHNSYPSFLIDGEDVLALANVVPDEGPRGQGVATEKVEHASALIFARAEAWLARREPGAPFFLYLPSTIPHANNEARARGMLEVPDLGRWADEDWPDAQQGHAALITMLDEHVGRVLALLEERGLARDTLVLFTSDNGPHAEGGLDPDFQDSNGPLRGIKRSLHEGGIRVPLLARWPGRVPAGAVSEHAGYFGDCMATLAELAGVAPPADVQSQSLAPTLLHLGRGQRRHAYLYWQFWEQGTREAVRFGRWKAIREPLFDGALRLYDLRADLGEARDVAPQEPEIAARAAAYMDAAHAPSDVFHR
jgi:arylsulfatase A-like enzyme